MEKRQEFISKLLLWHKGSPLDFPWRTTSNAYKILVSEILLRKTTRTQVKNIFTPFFTKYPDIYALHNSDLLELENIIKPLGMQFVRAKIFKKIAEMIVEKYEGKIPQEINEIRKLPHIGHYIANAVMCFAFKKKAAILDTNIIRVYQRVFNVRSSKSRPRTDKMLWSFAEEILPSSDYVKFNYALLDFASEICKARNPQCRICEVKDICLAFKPMTESVAQNFTQGTDDQ